jgi:hypothetical protein
MNQVAMSMTHDEKLNKKPCLHAVGLLSWLPSSPTSYQALERWLAALPKGWPLWLLDLEPEAKQPERGKQRELLNAYGAIVLPAFGVPQEKALLWGLAQVSTPWTFWMSPHEVLEQNAPYDFEDIVLQLASKGQQAALSVEPLGDFPFASHAFAGSTHHWETEHLAPRLLKTERVKALFWQPRPTFLELVTSTETFGLSFSNLQVGEANESNVIPLLQKPSTLPANEPEFVEPPEPVKLGFWQKAWQLLLRLFR